MKKLLLVAAATAALCGCQNAADNDEAAAPAASTTSAMAAATPAAAPTAEPGTYEVTQKDGSKFTSMLNADGTYQDTDASGKVSEKGKWANTGGKTCFDPDGDGETTCYTMGPTAADGSFTATPDKGDALTVKKTA
jgi:hypothetical protein